MPLRVVHWDVNFLSDGSVSLSVRGLATSQVRLGAEVAVVAAGRSSAPSRFDWVDGRSGARVFEWQPRWSLGFDPFLLRGVPSSARRSFRAFRPDLVHVHGGFNLDNLWVPRLFDCPIVVSPHGSYLPEVFRKGRRIVKSLTLQVERRLLFPHVAAVHALSPIEHTHLRRLLPYHRVYCLPQGPGVRMPPSVLREEAAGPSGTVTFVFVGRLDVPMKGLDILLDAFAHAEGRLNGHRICLVLIGPDWRGGRKWLQVRGQELGIADRVSFLGCLSGLQLPSALERSHIFIQLSRHDAFAMSVAEALLMGKPVIVSDAVGLASYPEIETLPHVRIVRGGVSEAAEAMVDYVHRLPELTIAAGQHRAELYRFFSWDRVAKSQLTMYGKIIAGSVADGNRESWRLPDAGHEAGCEGGV